MTQLQSTLRQLRLSGLMQTLELRLQEAAAARLGHGEFLELIFQDELNVRHQRMLARRTKAADFRVLKTLEDFDWQFNPSFNRKQIFELAAGSYLREAKDILFLGRPASAKPIWPRPLATKLSSRARKSFTAPSSTWCATSSKTKPLTNRTKRCADTSSLTS